MSQTVGAAAGADIAVIGMACRFPGAPSLEAFWENLRGGVESIARFSEAELLEAGVPRALVEHPDYVRAGGVLGDVGRFDAELFGFGPREAETMDPQQRVFLELCWEALERAGHDPRGGGLIGVYGGCSLSSYFLRLATHAGLSKLLSGYEMALGTDKDFLAPRVAYKLGLEGPAVAVQTACSTSLVAVHLACQGLLAGECDMALAGGVSIRLPETAGYLYQPHGILSRDGHNRAFDAGASGTVGGNGAGVVVLKRLADALRDGDRVAAVVKGSATNNDGSRRVGFTAPGVEGQAKVVAAALALAGIDPDSVGYVEAHGTATELGDPIEVAALTRVFRSRSTGRGRCGLGSVKTNVGHLDAAAGVAGLIKAVLMLEHRELVPSLHFQRPNPKIDLDAGPFFVVAQRQPWEARGTAPRRAGVSSFGMGGSNAHVVLEEAPAPSSDTPVARPGLLVVSARTKAALEVSNQRLADFLDENPRVPLADVAFTLRRGRCGLPQRRALVCRSGAEGARALAARDKRRVFDGVAAESPRPLAFLFPGQGAQHVGMALGLYASEPRFRREFDGCCERLEPLLGVDLRRVLYPEPARVEESARALQETRLTQPALFAVEYALARLWLDWGAEPEALLGHSVGEYVAACLAGVFTRDDALALVAERGRLMQLCPAGAMLAVPLSAAAALELLDEGLEIAADNGPDACVVAGPVADVERLEARLAAAEVPSSRLATSHAFHSALVDPALPAYREAVVRVRLEPPGRPFLSNLTGTWITPREATDPGYWVRQMRAPVRFGAALGLLLEEPTRALLEVGPGQALVSLARRRLGPDALALASLPHPLSGEDDAAHLLETAGRLWVVGVALDWTLPVDGEPRRRVQLPTYPFGGESYLVGVRPAGTPAQTLELPRLDPGQWLYAPSWKRVAPPARQRAAGQHVCLFLDGCGLGERLAEKLRGEGVRVTGVRPGHSFARRGPGEFTLDPDSASDHVALVRALQDERPGVGKFVHLWGVGLPREPEDLGACFYSVLHLGQALGRWQEQPTVLAVVAQGVQDVLGDEPLAPERALALGPCLVLPQEHPHLECRHIDLRLGEGPVPEALVEQLRVELTAGAPDPVVAYRGAHRWSRAFERLAGGEPALPRLRPGGTWLITGGLGRVGLALADGLVRRAKARLVLIGRTGLPPRGQWRHLAAGTDALAARIRAVEALEVRGAEVLVLAADVAEVDEMRAALEQVHKRFGPVHGVVHAAGAIDAQTIKPIGALTRADCERQLRPKLEGTRVLAGLLETERPDLVLLTSSLSTVLGGLGFAAYAAANHFLDAFAHRQHRRGQTAWLSVDWDAWRTATSGTVVGAGGGSALSAGEGGTLLRRILSLEPSAQIVVSTTELDARLACWRRPGGAEARPKAAAGGEAVPSHPRPELNTSYVAPEGAVEQRLAALWAALLGLERVGANDSFFELGGSSLLAVRLVGALRQEYGGELSVSTLFEAPTVRALAAVLGSRAGCPEGRPGPRAEQQEGVGSGNVPAD